ncbi:MAG: sugar phosphate isomerase/epimerase [Saprospiraceae bacterium]|nr:sugar phosphate isomerase/epimerase [Saprospiraceae bacterium]
MNRRIFLKNSALIAGGCLSSTWPAVFTSENKNRFKIGACDWSIGQRGKLEAFDVARNLGLDGLQISFRVNDFEPLLEKSVIQSDFQTKAEATGISIGSLALGLLNEFPYKSDARTEQWVIDSIAAAKNLRVKVILLAFFGKGDLKNDPEGQKEVIKRLKIAAPLAEEANVVLGIESWLSAEEHVEIMEAVQSPNVKVYYDVANSHKMGYNIFDEIRWLGKERICEFHAKENGYLLGQGNINLIEVRNALDDIDYEGWIQIEGAVPQDADLMESYVENVSVMREVFSN